MRFLLKNNTELSLLILNLGSQIVPWGTPYATDKLNRKSR